MPVNPCSENGKPGFKWGEQGKCYLYTPGDKKSLGEAKRKATVQGIATGEYIEKISVNVPIDKELYARVKSEAKAKFDVYPSAYANAWLVREYKKRGGKYKTVSKMDEQSFIKEEEMINGYPAATQDIRINIRNRQEAIDVANYGPINPALANEDYWANKADVFNTSIEDAKSARCANCAAFVQTKEIIDAIAHGLGGEPMAYEIAKIANLGYCDIFEFKCAGLRTCDAWIAGGPVKNIQGENNE